MQVNQQTLYNDGYAEEYELAEKKALYEQNEQLYWDTLKKWHIKDKEVNNSSGGGNGGSNSNDKSAAAADKSQKITALELMEDTYRAEKEAYEQALEEYNKAVETAHAGLDQAKAEYELLELELEQAKIDYEKKAAVCLADYETKQAEAANAASTYETTLQKLKDELDALENDKEEAAENLTTFEAAIGDGYLYTTSKGSVVMVAVSDNEVLEPDSIVLAYSDPTILTVTAAVDQEDIASIEIGDQATVMTEDGESFEAEVTKINPVSNSGSRASVTYAVTLSLEESEKLSANETVTVYFGDMPLKNQGKPEGQETKTGWEKQAAPGGNS
ncbi:MAG: HlyD family efflux transporter periplasmic adaptor subunit [Lachnospiraceae bacterium]|nr:HlyD family efflux transporter periplasmic adaptor subunit [Lachnospiraceae bacterium]